MVIRYWMDRVKITLIYTLTASITAGIYISVIKSFVGVYLFNEFIVRILVRIDFIFISVLLLFYQILSSEGGRIDNHLELESKRSEGSENRSAFLIFLSIFTMVILMTLEDSVLWLFVFSVLMLFGIFGEIIYTMYCDMVRKGEEN